MTKRRSPLTGTAGHRIRKLVRPWHRSVGVLGAAFLLLLTATGVAINHASDWGLSQTKVRQAWLLDYYGIQSPSHSGRFGDFGITDNLLWQDDVLLLEAQQPLIAVSRFNEQTIAIDREHLYLLSAAGDLLETQGVSTGLPVPLQALALQDERLWLMSDKGQYLADDDLIDYQPSRPASPLSWLTGTTADKTLILNARSAHLTWERVMLDLHSGRLFGARAIWLWDLLAFSFVLLALSGLYIWWSQKPKR